MINILNLEKSFWKLISKYKCHNRKGGKEYDLTNTEEITLVSINICDNTEISLIIKKMKIK